MEEELLFKSEFDWDKRINKKEDNKRKLKQAQTFCMGMLYGAGGLFVFQLLLTIVDKL